MTKRQWTFIAFIYLAGLVTLLGSTVTDDDDSGPSAPTIITFTMNSVVIPALDIKRGPSASEPLNIVVNELRLAGEFEKRSGDLILNTDALELDASSFIDFELSGEISGTGRMDITDIYRRETRTDPTPDFGQYTVIFEGETTTVTARGGDGALVDTPVMSSLGFSWADFESAINDTDADINVRVAGLMETVMILVVDLAEIAESVQRSFVNNDNALESNGVGMAFDIACLNATEGGEDALLWTLDTNLNDLPDSGDEFERQFRNCQDSGSRYFDGTVEVRNYDFDQTSALRNLGMTSDFGVLRLLSEPFTLGLATTDDNPEVDGTLRFRYDQVPATPITP